jgi:hypothetical protein
MQPLEQTPQTERTRCKPETSQPESPGHEVGRLTRRDRICIVDLAGQIIDALCRHTPEQQEATVPPR